jgi:DNA-binding response OmpR family regulator
MSQQSVLRVLRANKGKWFNYKQLVEAIEKEDGVKVTNSTVTSNVGKLLKWNMIEVDDTRKTKRGQHIRMFRAKKESNGGK